MNSTAKKSPKSSFLIRVTAAFTTVVSLTTNPPQAGRKTSRISLVHAVYALSPSTTDTQSKRQLLTKVQGADADDDSEAVISIDPRGSGSGTSFSAGPSFVALRWRRAAAQHTQKKIRKDSLPRREPPAGKAVSKPNSRSEQIEESR